MPTVIKYGGSAMTDPEVRRQMAQRLAALPETVVVHGGGPFIAQALRDAGLKSHFVRGLRVTDAPSLAVIERTLTRLSKVLAQEIGDAVGLQGRDARLLVAEPLGAELGFVGEVVEVNRALLTGLLGLGLTPVVACLAATPDRRGVLNVNADSAAGAVAGALAAPVVFLSDVPGVLEDPAVPESRLATLSARDIAARIADGRIAGGMIPKVEAALGALRAGAPVAIIADGRVPEQLEASLRGEVGTRVVR
ncbi:acetylglutamate kinase [Truepera radiovictrix]|uniref:Acetylglutamate kinase n=1 Tax=Truepera radiovictrix (strain DSM 17093 / CIP 108686 / LMG 22925 / RQ-24) TaxID=649638 RepID=D7CS58_TRURR|nr:acetylglutamate kinase [Truepera radiovictrix]ADI13590.1 acetylglutamate kinase [Truepera radiovictrix DSM 17093]WMT57847.1 acetylglutamate kinase [Truepera radiovictrix]